MKIKSLVSTQKDRFNSNFNKASLGSTKRSVSKSINTDARQGKLQVALESKDASIAARQALHDKAAMKKSLLAAGASKDAAEQLVNHFIATHSDIDGANGGKALSLKGLGMSIEGAEKFFDKLVNSTTVGANKKHFAELVSIMENSQHAENAKDDGYRHLRSLMAKADSASSFKINVIHTIGTLLLQRAIIHADGAGAIDVDFRTSYRLPLRERDASATKLRFSGVDMFEQQKAMAKLKIGMTYDKAGKGLLEAKRGLLDASANVAGSLAAASRPLAAVAASPVLVAAAGLGTVAVGTAATLTAVTIGTLTTGVVLGTGAITGLAIGSAAAAAPLWAVGVTVADGITGGPGVAGRSKNIFKGNEVRKNLGLPSKEAVRDAKSSVNGMFKNIGKGFSKSR